MVNIYDCVSDETSKVMSDLETSMHDLSLEDIHEMYVEGANSDIIKTSSPKTSLAVENLNLQDEEDIIYGKHYLSPISKQKNEPSSKRLQPLATKLSVSSSGRLLIQS